MPGAQKQSKAPDTPVSQVFAFRMWGMMSWESTYASPLHPLVILPNFILINGIILY